MRNIKLTELPYGLSQCDSLVVRYFVSIKRSKSELIKVIGSLPGGMAHMGLAWAGMG